jgi:hypothetical protein
MLGGDGMDSCTRVPAAKRARGLWPCPVVLDNKSHRFLRPWRLVKIYWILEAPGWSDQMPGPIPGWGGRHTEQTGGEILPVHVYRNEKKVTVWISLGL